MAKAVYTKMVGEKSEMCSDCYRVGHYKKDCPGERNWMEYCREFKEVWDEVMLDRNDEFQVPTGLDTEQSRLLSMNKELVSEIESLEDQKKQAEAKIKEISDKTGLEEIGKKAKYFEKKNQEHVKRIQELEDKVSKMGDLSNIGNIEAVHGEIERLRGENNELRDRIQTVETENMQLEDQVREGDANLKKTYRRLSKSVANEEINLDSTVGNEMFVEVSPPFHGYSTAEIESDKNEKIS